MKHVILTAAAAAALLAVPAPAQTPVRVGGFDSVELRGGGDILIRHGAEHRVTLLRGDPSLASFEVERDGTLVIQPCRTSCRNQNLRVEVVTPEVEAVAINGGGSIRIEGGFPREDSLAVAINGGGTIDARAVRARSVAAAINGGGLIRTSAERSLAASIRGGGAVRYLGDPEKTVSIRGGGTVTPDRP